MKDTLEFTGKKLDQIIGSHSIDWQRKYLLRARRFCAASFISKMRESLPALRQAFWRRAGDSRIQLKAGDQIRLAAGRWARVVSVLPKGKARVYNFMVEQNQNYFVGETKLLMP